MNDKLCISKYKDNETNGNLILKNILEDIVSTNFNMNILNNNESIIINESFITFIITNTRIQNKMENKTINLGKCENILKNYYNKSETEELVIFFIKDQQYKKSGYEIFSNFNGNQMEKLNLSLCKDIIINNNDIINC